MVQSHLHWSRTDQRVSRFQLWSAYVWIHANYHSSNDVDMSNLSNSVQHLRVGPFRYVRLLDKLGTHMHLSQSCLDLEVLSWHRHRVEEDVARFASHALRACNTLQRDDYNHVLVSNSQRQDWRTLLVEQSTYPFRWKYQSRISSRVQFDQLLLDRYTHCEDALEASSSWRNDLLDCQLHTDKEEGLATLPLLDLGAYNRLRLNNYRRVSLPNFPSYSSRFNNKVNQTRHW